MDHIYKIKSNMMINRTIVNSTNQFIENFTVRNLILLHFLNCQIYLLKTPMQTHLEMKEPILAALLSSFQPDQDQLKQATKFLAEAQLKPGTPSFIQPTA
jgi:hypothetical protein